MENVITERMEALDQKARDSVERRNNHVRMLMESKDPVRLGKNNKSPLQTISSDDLEMIAELALIGCGACPQGKYVKHCPYRAMFHRLGVPIAREDVQDGQCEFMTRDEPKIFMPNGYTDDDARRKFTEQEKNNIEALSKVRDKVEAELHKISADKKIVSAYVSPEENHQGNILDFRE